MTDTIKLLIIDDNPEDRMVYKRLLTSVTTVEYSFSELECGDDGLDFIQNYFADCILLDYNLPDMDGIEVLKSLAEMDGFHTPVIFLTGQGNESIAVQAMKNGATDYLVKTDINSEFLNRSIHYAIEKKQSEQKLHHYVLELEKANRQILEQQKAVIEEERLNVILQMAGATAHEMNQPLMSLLGNIQLLSMDQSVPDSVQKHITRIREAGDRLADIVKKIQTIRHYETKEYPGGEAIIQIDQSLNLLVIEDNDNDYDIIMTALTEFENISVNRLKDISELIGSQVSADLILLDYMLPSGTGFDVLHFLEQQGLEIPVIMVTGAGDEVLASKIIQAGAYDYLPKSRVTQNSLTRAINNALEKHRLKNEAQAAVRKMAEMSTIDELTGLFNRRYFQDMLQVELDRAIRYEADVSLFIMDIDYFKVVNDTYGHPAGDQVLKEISRILKQCLRSEDIPCRYGGEELAVILPSTSLEEGAALCERFRKTLEKTSIIWGETSIQVTVSIGIATSGKQFTESYESIINIADTALYQAKSDGRNRVVCGTNA